MGYKVLLGTVGSDVHSVANTLLEKAFLDSGFEVINLGVAVPEDEWVENVGALGPDLILIGSMNGDLLPLTSTIKKILKHAPGSEIVIGGKLNLGSQGLSNAPLIKAMGVSVLEDDEISFQEIINFCGSILKSNIKGGFKEIRDAR
jgi:methylaspartate mutase sigma subunit